MSARRTFERPYLGVVQQRRNRITGTLVSVVDNRREQMAVTEDGRWFAVCEDHGSMLATETRYLAEHHAACPDWCEDCAPRVLEEV